MFYYRRSLHGAKARLISRRSMPVVERSEPDSSNLVRFVLTSQAFRTSVTLWQSTREDTAQQDEMKEGCKLNMK